MIITQRRLHARAWPLLTLGLLVLLVVSIMARRAQPFSRTGLPGAAAAAPQPAADAKPAGGAP